MAMSPPDVRIAVLGPLEVEVDGAPVDVPSGQQRRALVSLALAAGGVVSTDRLVALLWGDQPPPSAVNSLQSHLARLRRTLGSSDVVERAATGYRLLVRPDQVDAVAFQARVEEATRTVDPVERRRHLDEALALWRAETADEVTAAGLADAAVGLEQRRLGALLARAETALAVGDAASAEQDLRAVLRADPLREPAVIGLVHALAADGRTAEADAAVQAYRERLADELGLDPSPQLVDVHTRLVRGDLHPPPAGAPPPAPRPARRPGGQRPPRPGSSFLGREAVLDGLVRSVRGDRCITLVGPGGVGKTRLATELAHRVDGDVWWATLVDARSVADVLGRVALAVGTGTPPTLDDLGTLADALVEPGAVLVLDNCEQAADAVASVVEHLLAATAVHVVATSRSPLHVDGEHVVALAPLAITATGQDLPPALAMFLDRVGGGVDVHDPAQRSAAEEVVRSLDGLPLALELAARQVRNLGLGPVRDRLDQRLELLQAGRRQGHPAHGDLRELVRWSTDQLDEADRRLFRWLSAFAGRFTLDRAEALARAAGPLATGVPAALARLVEQSLVTRDDDGWFRMLETLRACAAEDLAATGEAAEVRDAHAAVVIAAVQAADARLTTPEEGVAVAELHGLVPDVQAAAAHVVATEDVPRLCQLGGALRRYAYDRQRLGLLDCARVAADVLDTRRDRELDLDLVVAARTAAAVEAAGGVDGRRARRLAEAAVASTSTGSVRGDVAAVAWSMLGDILLSQGDPAAGAAYDRVIELGEAGELPWAVTEGWIGRALLLAYTGDHAAARAAADEATRLADAVGIPSFRAWAAYVRGEAEAGLDPELALTAFAEAIELAGVVDCHLAVWAASSGIAAVRARHGDPLPVLRQLRDTLRSRRRAGSAAVEQTVLRHVGVLLARTGHDRAAAVLLGAGATGALYEAERHRIDVALAAVTERLGTVAAEQLRDQGARMAQADLVEVALAAVEDALGP